MAKGELFVIPIPGVPRNYSRSEIYLLATEDMQVLNLVDTDDPGQACQIAKRHFSGFDIVVFSVRALGEPGCRTTQELPAWAARWRLEFAIEEGSCDWLKRLPMGLGRDLFFQGTGAFVKWQEQIVGMRSDFLVFVTGTIRSQIVDTEVRLFIDAAQPGHLLTEHKYRSNSGGGLNKRFDLRTEQQPDYLVPLFEQAFQLPAVPYLQVMATSGGREEGIIEDDLATIGMALGAAALIPQDPQGGTMRLESALYDLEAHVTRVERSAGTTPTP